MTIPGALFGTFGYLIGAVNIWTAIVIWVLATTVGLLQNAIFAEMAAMFPDKSGGVSRYAAEGWKRYCAPLAAVAAFGYWLGWSLSISIAALVFGELISAAWFPGTDLSIDLLGNHVGLPHLLAILAMLGGWLVNYFGTKVGSNVNRGLGAIVMCGLVIVTAAAFLSPGAQWSAGNLHWGYTGDWRTLVVVYYVTSWATYATELCASFAPEYRDTVRDTWKALWSSSVLMIAVFLFVPMAVGGSLGEAAITDNPVAFISLVFDKALGGWGWLGTTVIAAACLASVIANTADGGRALYGLARSGLTLKQLDYLNRFGVPSRSLTLDVGINIVIMLLVGTPVSILLASNFGYVLSMVLGLSAFVLLRRDRPNWPRPIRRGPGWTVIAWVLILGNAFVAMVGLLNPTLLGGDLRQSVIALAIILISVVVYVYRQRVQDGHAVQWRIETPSLPTDDSQAPAVTTTSSDPRGTRS